MSDIDKRVIEWESELVQHQAEQYRKIQDYERLAAENARLREALQNVIQLAQVSFDGDPYYAEQAGLNGDTILDTARAALA